jgi:hypothetical protein
MARAYYSTCKMGLEGTASKRFGSRYRSGRSKVRGITSLFPGGGFLLRMLPPVFIEFVVLLRNRNLLLQPRVLCREFVDCPS